MSKIKEAIVEAVLPAIKAVGKAEITEVLSRIQENNPTALYENMLRGLHINFSLLKEAANKTRTRIDDGIIELVLDAVNEKAAASKLALNQDFDNYQ